MSFVLAIGVDFAEKSDDSSSKSGSARPSSRLPQLRDMLERCERHEALISVSPTVGCIEMENYDEVDAFIRRLTADCLEYGTNVPGDQPVCCFIAVCWRGDGEDGGAALRAQMLLAHMIGEDRARWNLPVAVVVTAKTYGKLLPKFQDTYHSSTEIRDIEVHQRFREGVAPCFVISPIGEAGSVTRKRADEVFETYIKPACDPLDYRAVRGEMMSGGRITPDIEEALQTSPMVIAYLGSPKLGWNPNVMYEYGHRKAVGLPVVVLKDATVDGKPYDLPFDLKDERCVDLPEAMPTDFDDLAPKIRTIRDLMAKAREGGWTTVYPSAIVDVVIGRPNEQLNRYIEASPELETLFELPHIEGRTLGDVIEHLAKKMSPDQYSAFLKDQDHIMGNLVLGKTKPKYISATVPILFECHTTLHGRAYLPIIASHLFVQATNTFRLNVVYIEVTLATHREEGEPYFRCPLIRSDVFDAESD